MHQGETLEYTKTTKIHPINAQYILDSEPHRLYADADGNLLEIVVQKFAYTVAEKLYGLGGIVAIGYHDATTNGMLTTNSTYILRPNGNIYEYSSQEGGVGGAIDLDLYYMTLNPVEMNNWYLQDPNKMDTTSPKQQLDILIFNTRMHFLKQIQF